MARDAHRQAAMKPTTTRQRKERVGEPLLPGVDTVEIVIIRQEQAPAIMLGCLADDPAAIELFGLVSAGVKAISDAPGTLCLTCDVELSCGVGVPLARAPSAWLVVRPALRDQRLAHEGVISPICPKCAGRRDDRSLVDHFKSKLTAAGGAVREIQPLAAVGAQ